MARTHWKDALAARGATPVREVQIVYRTRHTTGAQQPKAPTSPTTTVARPASPAESPFTPPATIEEGETEAAELKEQMRRLHTRATELNLSAHPTRSSETERRSIGRDIIRISARYTPLRAWVRAQRHAAFEESEKYAPALMLRLLTIVERLALDGAELTDDECGVVDRAMYIATKVRAVHRCPESGE